MENIGLTIALASALAKGPTDTQVTDAVDAWLDDHPEATTTVEDGSITKAKLSNSLISELASSGADEQLGKFVNYYKDGIILQLTNCTQTSTGLDPLVLTGTGNTTAIIKIPFEDFVSDYTSGDAYYFRFTIETSTDCTGFSVKDFRGNSSGEVSGASDLRPGPNNPVTFSFVSTNYTGSTNSLIIKPTISSGLSGVTITLSNIWLINLTKQFDLIPSLGQIDHLIDTGTEYLYSPKTYASTVPYLGVKNELFDRRTGTISANAGSNGNLNCVVVETSDYISGVTKGYAAFTFQVVGATQIATGSSVKAGSHYNCARYLTTDEITALNNGEWVTISIANGRTGGSDTKVSYNITFKFVDNTITNKINWRNAIGINLTEAFGAGNEPSRESMDDILSLYADKRPPYKYSLLTTARSVVAKPRGIEGTVGDEQFVRTMPEGNVMMSSMPFPRWSGWSEIGTYGQTNVSAIPIYNKVHGTIETDGMVSVLPLWGCWSANASDDGTARGHHGAHVFHGWTTDRQHRLTMTQNIYSDDEASIFNYIPGDKSGTSGGIFLPLRLGTDSLYNGLSLTPVYVDGAGYAFRAKLTGIMNLNYKDGVFPKPTSSSSSGTKGDICFDSDYIYVCVDTDSWKRVALSTW